METMAQTKVSTSCVEGKVNIGVLQSTVIEKATVGELIRIQGLIAVEMNLRTMRAIKESKRSKKGKR